MNLVKPETLPLEAGSAAAERLTTPRASILDVRPKQTLFPSASPSGCYLPRFLSGLSSGFYCLAERRKRLSPTWAGEWEIFFLSDLKLPRLYNGWHDQDTHSDHFLLCSPPPASFVQNTSDPFMRFSSSSLTLFLKNSQRQNWDSKK